MSTASVPLESEWTHRHMRCDPRPVLKGKQRQAERSFSLRCGFKRAIQLAAHETIFVRAVAAYEGLCEARMSTAVVWATTRRAHPTRDIAAAARKPPRRQAATPRTVVQSALLACQAATQQPRRHEAGRGYSSCASTKRTERGVSTGQRDIGQSALSPLFLALRSLRSNRRGAAGAAQTVVQQRCTPASLEESDDS